LSVFDERLIGGPGEEHVTDPPDLLLGSLASKAVQVDLTFPVTKTRARSRTHGAALLAVGAVVWSTVEIEVKRLIDTVVGLVVKDRVGARDHARRTARAQS
jgi:hypothetical protein